MMTPGRPAWRMALTSCDDVDAAGGNHLEVGFFCQIDGGIQVDPGLQTITGDVGENDPAQAHLIEVLSEVNSRLVGGFLPAAHLNDTITGVQADGDTRSAPQRCTAWRTRSGLRTAAVPKMARVTPRSRMRSASSRLRRPPPNWTGILRAEATVRMDCRACWLAVSASSNAPSRLTTCRYWAPASSQRVATPAGSLA